MTSKKPREFWIGWPDAETPEILDPDDIALNGPRGAVLFREVSAEHDALVNQLASAVEAWIADGDNDSGIMMDLHEAYSAWVSANASTGDKK